MDFVKFYEEQPEYENYRRDDSKRAEYNIIINWKVRNLLQIIPQDSKVTSLLEVGCAFGLLLKEMKDRLNVGKAIGVDISTKNVKLGRTLYPDIQFFQGTIQDFATIPEIIAAKVDVIILSDIIEHIPDDTGFLSNVAEYGHYLIINLPLEKSFITRNRNYGEEDPSGHLRCYDLAASKRLFAQAGLRMIDYSLKMSLADKQVRDLEKNAIKERLKNKPPYRSIPLGLLYSMKMSLRYFPVLYRRVLGVNLFALCTKA